MRGENVERGDVCRRCFDRSDMHLALLADVMCGEELWPQLFGLAFHHDFSFPMSIFPLTASAACQYSLPIFTLSLTVLNPSDRRLRGGEASRRLITARADEGRRYPTGGSPSGRKRFVYLPYTIKVFVRITRHPVQPVLARILRLFRIHDRILREEVPCRLGMSRQLRGGVGSPAYRATQLHPAQ